MNNICVYCGSRVGKDPIYQEEAKKLASELVANNLGLVYGGSNIGIMNTIANEVLRLGGKVTGVIPEVIDKKGLAHQGLTTLHKVDSMHSRKLLMEEISDGFIAFPGGLGTLDELCEILTWIELKIHNKPCALLNFNSFYKYFLKHLKISSDEGFIDKNHLDLLIVKDTSKEIIKAILGEK